MLQSRGNQPWISTVFTRFFSFLAVKSKSNFENSWAKDFEILEKFTVFFLIFRANDFQGYKKCSDTFSGQYL